MKVLVVEDSPDVLETINLCIGIRWPDSHLLSTGSGGEALRLARAEHPDLIILDLGLPDVDGISVLEEVRRYSHVPVIIVTARAAVAARVKGLETGADDYVVKPFSHTELLARIQAVMRRGNRSTLDADAPSNSPSRLEGSGLNIDLRAHRVLADGREVHLTPTEWKLLELLAANHGKVVTHQAMAQSLWGAEELGASSIKMIVRRLRLKLARGDDARNVVRSYRGMGYTFDLTAPTTTDHN